MRDRTKTPGSAGLGGQGTVRELMLITKGHDVIGGNKGDLQHVLATENSW